MLVFDDDDRKRRRHGESNKPLIAIVILSCFLWSYYFFTTFYQKNQAPATFFSPSAPAPASNQDLILASFANSTKQTLLSHVTTQSESISRKLEEINNRLAAVEKSLTTVAELARHPVGAPGFNQVSFPGLKQSTTNSFQQQQQQQQPVALAVPEIVTNQLFPPLECQGTLVSLSDGVVGYRQASRKDRVSLPEDIVTVVHTSGVKIATHGSGDTISRALKSDGTWEIALVAMIQGLSKHFRTAGVQVTFLDIGSNLGLMGLIPAFDGHQVLFFEPVTQNLNLICESVALNNVGENTIVFPMALSSAKSKFYMTPNENNFGTTRIITARPQPPTPFVEVPAETLDSVAPQLGITDKTTLIVKIDVEGAEYFVWQGGKQLLASQNIQAIFFENSWLFEPFMETRIQWLKEIEAMGYRLFCCADCQDVQAPGGRCVPVDTENREELLKHGAELVALRSDEILKIISNAV